MKKHYRHENNCLNCGTTLQGNYCHNCGQENLEIKESFGHMLNHAVSDYFHFDHQFFHTLKPLFFSPGKLTNEYLAGRRAQYLHPIKMYIFISLVFFLIFFKNKHAENVVITPSHTEEKINSRVHVNKSVPDEHSRNADLKSNAAENDTVTANMDIADVVTFKNVPRSYEEYLHNQQKLPENKRDGFFKRLLTKKSIDWSRISDSHERKELFWETFKHNIPKMMFVLLPIFAWLLKVAFGKNRKYYVEHLIYAIHLHCFIYTFLATIILLKLLLPDSWQSVSNLLDTVGVIIITWYVYRSLRTVYHRTPARTISKMAGVGFAYSFVFATALIGLIIIIGLIAA